VHQARYRGALDDYGPLAIRKYLRKKLRREVRSDLKKEIRNLKKTVRLLRAKNAELFLSQRRLLTRSAKNLPALNRPHAPTSELLELATKPSRSSWAKLSSQQIRGGEVFLVISEVVPFKNSIEHKNGPH